MAEYLQNINSTYLSHSRSGQSPEKSFSTYQGIHHIVILAVCIAILTAAILLQVNEAGLSLLGFNWPLRCFLYETFGIKCSLCGLTRSLTWMAHGNLQESIRLHHIGPAVFAFICLQIPYRIGAVTIFSEKLTKRWARVNLYIAILLCAAILINWLIYLGGLLL
jgi:hypothetical protein